MNQKIEFSAGCLTIYLTVNLFFLSCLLQPGPGIVCFGLWTSASTTWRSTMLNYLMTLCTSVRPQRPPCAPGGPNSMYSVSDFLWTIMHIWVNNLIIQRTQVLIIKLKNAKLILVPMLRDAFLREWAQRSEASSRMSNVVKSTTSIWMQTFSDLIQPSPYYWSYLMRHSCRKLPICFRQPNHRPSWQVNFQNRRVSVGRVWENRFCQCYNITNDMAGKSSKNPNRAAVCVCVCVSRRLENRFKSSSSEIWKQNNNMCYVVIKQYIYCISSFSWSWLCN